MNFIPTIVIDVTPEYFVFTKGDIQYRFETCVNYTNEKDILMPTAIGENKEIPGSTLVRLFDPEMGNELNKFSFLQWFIEYGIGKIFEKNRFPSLRPLIIFRGAESLKNLLPGYHVGLLHQAGLLAGAREVQFARFGLDVKT